MPLKHLLILLFIAVAHGSAFPITKLVLNDSVPPILMSSLRMGLVLVLLIPFWKFRIPEKKYITPLIAFSISMGVMVYAFMTLSLYYSSIVSPVIVGSQLAIPFGILASAVMLGENISFKKWMLIISSFIGILIIFFDPKLTDNFLDKLNKSNPSNFIDPVSGFNSPTIHLIKTDFPHPEPPRITSDSFS